MKERIDGLCKMHTAKNCLGFAAVMPGLFHLKIVVTNTFWQTHVQPQESHGDLNGFFKYICHLHPKETGKFLNSPGFQHLHNSIHHTTWIDVLDYWRVEANGLHFGSQVAYAESKPSWDSLVELLEAMVRKHLPDKDFDKKREEEGIDHDMVFENTALCQQHSLLYLELYQSMNHGDVGQIL